MGAPVGRAREHSDPARGSGQRTFERGTMTATLEAIAGQIEAGELDKADKALATGSGRETDPQYLYLRGLLCERRYNYEDALNYYYQALELRPDYVDAAFRAAYVHDLTGDDDSAIELYEICIDRQPVHSRALINLAVLYEETGELAKAETNLRHVLNDFPTHVRAQHFIESVESSYSMVIDERSQRDSERRSAVLDVPITEFELSVRSRNCLRQMNIRTLGDLLKITEAELLAYKNFGETSLNEIKTMLSQKGLRLGQAAPRAAEGARPAPTSGLGSDANIHQSKPVSELELSVRSRKCLQRLGIATLGELTGRSEAELMAIKNFGQTSLNEIKRQLALFGLTLRAGR